DLGAGSCAAEKVGEEVYQNLLSGVGLGAWYLCRNIPPGADPLGPDNILGFTTGLFTGTGAVMAGRWMAVCKSPLTGGWGDSNCGGTLAIGIKQCGYDAIFVKGISPRPVYLLIDSKGPSILPAEEYWGLDAIEAEARLAAAQGPGKKPSIAVIGPAGEKLSLISGISNDLGRYAARSGVGAVMGSKRLKAIVLRGNRPIKGGRPEEIKAKSRLYADKVRAANFPGFVPGSALPLMGRAMSAMKRSGPMPGLLTTMLLKRWGTAMNNTLAVANGDAPLKNWTGSREDYDRSYYSNLDPAKVNEREIRKYHCYSCVIGCGGVCDISGIRDSAGQGSLLAAPQGSPVPAGEMPAESHKPEYETAMVFGGLLMNKDLDSIFLINDMLNRAGMDSISAGGAVAFAIECFERGIIGPEDTGGLVLRWGDPAAIIALLRLMIARKGIGDILADGVAAAAKRIGRGSEAFAVHAGGQELPMHDPKVDPMLGVAYSADPTPGRHTTSGDLYYSTSALWKYVSWAPRLGFRPKSEAREDSPENALRNVAQTCFKMLIDCTGSCYYAMLSGLDNYPLFDLINAVADWDKSPDELMEIGKRAQTLRQQFNAIQGAEPKSFRMHRRASGDEALASGPTKGIKLETDSMVASYWKAWGWDPSIGLPTSQTLSALGLDKLLGKESPHAL
ncbi:MAG TPA: aldehyde ferredoxin oxidoreductase C-terminal domain-containing protein, partial [Rectinemataceae bacterium]